MGMAACGGDDSDDLNDNPINQNEDNQEPTDLELNAENLAKFVKANISYNADEWLYTANIQTSLMSSPLAGKVAGKEVKYGMRVYYETSYEDDDYEYIKVYILDNKTGGYKLYANDNGNNNFQVSVYTPYYYSTVGQNKYTKKKESLDRPRLDLLGDFGDYQKTIAFLEQLIQEGKATNNDKEMYYRLVGNIEESRNSRLQFEFGDLYNYSETIAEVFLKIDNKIYVVATDKNHSVRIPTYADISFSSDYSTLTVLGLTEPTLYD